MSIQPAPADALADVRRSPRRILPLLVAFAAVGPFALNLPLPAVPGLAAALNADIALVQLTITLYLAGLGVAQLALGPLSDRYGRRPVLIAGFSLAILASLAAGLAESVEALIVARIAQSLGAAAGVVVGRAVVRDLFDRERSAAMLSWVTVAMVVAPMVAPFLGGLITESAGWRWTFLTTAFVAFLTLVSGILYLPETRAAASAPTLGELARDARALMVDRAFLGYVGVAAFSSITFFVFIGSAPHVVVTLMDESAKVYGLWFIVNAAGYMLGNAVSGRYTERVGLERMLAIGSVLMVVGSTMLLGFALAGLITSPVVMFAPQALVAFANGLQLPGSIAGAVSVNPRAAGSAAGISGFAQLALGAIGAQAGGVLVVAYGTPIPMALIGFAGAVLALASMALIPRRPPA